MNKICIIGNSHMGALKLAYEYNKINSIDLYGCPGKGFSSLYIKDNKLLADDKPTKNYIKLTNGNDFIPLDKYIHILVYGCQILNNSDWMGYYSSAISKTYSENCLSQACIDRLKVAFGFNLAKMIKKSKICEKVTIIPSPLVSETYLPFYHNKLVSSSTAVSASLILDKLELFYKNYLEKYGINVLWTPSKLLAKNGFTTDIQYKLEREKDIAHLNLKGGEIVLEHIYNYLGM